MKIIIWIILFFSLFLNALASSQAQVFYDNFRDELESRNFSIERQLQILNTLDGRISNFLNKTNNNQAREVLRDLLILNKRQIILIQRQNTAITQNNNSLHELSSLSNTQSYISENYYENKSDIKENYNIEEVISNEQSKKEYSHLSNHIIEIIDSWFDFLEINEKNEFLREGNTFRINFSNFYRISQNNIRYFINNYDEWFVLDRAWEFILVVNSNIERKYTYDSLKNLFTNFLDFDDRFTLKDDRYITYSYDRYVFFDDKEWVYLTDLNRNRIFPNSTLFIKKDWEYFFSNNYRKVDLVDSGILNWVSNKQEFLVNLLDDNRFLEWNYDQELLEIKEKTRQITRNHLSDNAKIFAIYRWVAREIEYYYWYLDWNKEIYSWIYSFKNKSWVCDWYSKLMLYMLSFAWIQDAQVIKWFAFDTPEFPDFWHAWVRIWDKYYDPTFDEQNAKNSRDFVYFALPYDLMYIDRFEWFEIPSHLKLLSLNQRRNLSLKNLIDIYEKYPEYKITNRAKNYLLLWISSNNWLEIDLLKERLPFYEVTNFRFNDWNIEKRIRNFRFFNIDNDNLRSIISNPNIDLRDFKLFYWRDDWTYKLSYDIEYH